MTRERATAFFALILGITLSSAPRAQDIKLYAFSSGALTIGKGALVNLAPMEPMIQVPVGFYVVKHPKGNVLFDTGNNDKIITDPSYWGAAFKALKPVNTPDVAIDTQLQKIGLTPDDITYVVVEPPAPRPWRQCREVPEVDPRRPEERDPERLLARARDRRPLHDRRRHAAALAEHGQPERGQDGSAGGRHGSVRRRHVVVKRWVGHTPGSQMMTVRLKNNGPMILTGDNVYFRENVEKNIAAEYRAGLLAVRHSSAPSSGSAMRWRRKRPTSSPPMIPTRSRR